MNARLTSAAQADLASALEWYRDRRVDLDRRFLASFDDTIGEIAEHPEIGVLVEGEIRRRLMRGFPYGVFYLVRDSEAIVIACLHGARDPDRWRGRGAA